MATPPLKTHRIALARWRATRRQVAAGAGSFAAGMVAWAFGVDAAVHVAALLAGAGVGALLPPRADERRALRWVGERAGLAYETAWEAERAAASDRGADATTVALREAVVVAARLSVRDVAPPPIPAWWLPLAAAALLTLAWPHPTPVGAPSGAGASKNHADEREERTGENPATPEVPASELSPDDATPVGNRAQGETGPQGEAGPLSGGGPRSEAGGAASDAAGRNAPVSEREALERFVTRAQESNAAASAEEPDPRESAGAEEPPDGAAGRSRGGETNQDGRSAGDVGADAARSDGVPDGADEGVGERAGSGGGGDRASSDDGVPADDRTAGEAAAGERVAPDEGLGGAGSDAAANDLAGAGTDPAPDPGAARGAEGSGVGDEGAPGAASAPGEGDAGIGAGVPGGASVAAASDPATAEGGEALPSIVGPGPSTAVGAAPWSGAGIGEGPFPAGAAGAAYARAVETALLEGDLPAPYQEIVRSYFR